ncbi:hypothetical protein BDV98DRAFT_406590 [Pterulicium gracile]|uniref:Uncharacterized protein n=1 Tax=Pterulicium gracile TaxID=1884261 RepID=A0A5C3QMT9_9AGAR|nr:hypothetical protein BDV98DRAFT_406590 [Pterula gracilis]
MSSSKASSYRESSFAVPENQGLSYAVLAAPSQLPRFLQPNIGASGDPHSGTKISNTPSSGGRILSRMSSQSSMFLAALPNVFRGCITAQAFDDVHDTPKPSHEKVAFVDITGKVGQDRSAASSARTSSSDDQDHATLASTLPLTSSPAASDDKLTAASSQLTLDRLTSSDCPWTTSSIEVKTDQTGTRTDIHETDVKSGVDFTVTRTIIRPVLPARLCILDSFSSTSLVPAREPTPIVRHVSSMEGLMKSFQGPRGEPFELEIDMVQEQRDLGLRSIEIFVTKEVTITSDKKQLRTSRSAGVGAVPMTELVTSPAERLVAERRAYLNVRD